jgi:hypothetical protein
MKSTEVFTLLRSAAIGSAPENADIAVTASTKRLWRSV